MSFNVEDILNVSNGTWYGNNQWMRDGVPIVGATSSRYDIVADSEIFVSAIITVTTPGTLVLTADQTITIIEA